VAQVAPAPRRAAARRARPASRRRARRWWPPATFKARLLWIVGAGLLFRFVYVAFDVAGDRGFDDRQWFHDVSNNLAAGRGFISPFVFDFFGTVTPSAGHPPLWAAVLSVPAFFGLGSWTAQQFITAIFGAAAIGAVGYLGRRVGGDRIGLIAAGLAAVSPLLIARDGSLMSESLYGFLVILALLATYRVIDKPVSRSAAILGVLIGLAALTRGEALLFLPILAFVVWRQAKPKSVSRGRLLVVMVVAAAVTLAPWTIRNFFAFDEPVLISFNEASVLAGANCDKTYNGPETGTWDITCLAAANPNLDEPAQHAIWRKQGLDYIGDHIGDLPRVLFYRVIRTWDLYEPSAQAHGDGRDYNVAVIGTWTYLFVLLPLGIWGALRLYWRRKPLLILLSPAIVATISAAMTWGLTRLRHPADLTLLVLDAVALAAAYQTLRAREQRKRAVAGGGRRPAPTAPHGHGSPP
jgi:4-amino-4-deoxy-L-arabinose transferase-like glycosyltransferase